MSSPATPPAAARPAFPGPIVVVGEALVDDYGSHGVVGGAPFNVARHLAALGAPVHMITRVADDAAGALIRADLARFGLGTAGLQQDAQHPTGRVRVERQGAGHVFHILDNQAWDHLDTAQALASWPLPAGQPVATLYAGTLAQRAPASAAAVQAVLGQPAASHFVDLNLRQGQFSWATVARTLAAADTAKLNEDELRELMQAFDLAEAAAQPWGTAPVAAAVAALMQRFGLARLIVTRGPDGACCIDADGSQCAAPACPLPSPLPSALPGQAGGPAGDTVGAGDALAAVYLLGTALGWPLALCLARANAFAADICGLDGAVPADLSFYAPWRQAWGLA